MSARACVLLVVLAGVGAACSSTSSTTPSSLTAVFTEVLAPSNEVPPATGPETSATGNAVITLSYAEDASGNVTSATANFQVTLNGFPSTTVITMAHIHQAPVGQAGAIVVNTGLASGAVPIVNGTATITVNGVNVPSDIAQQMLANSPAFYFNVHTVANPSGVARGQLVRVQ